MNARAKAFEVDDDIEAINRLYREKRWGDGLPVIPPTRERVERMLAGTRRSPDEVVARIAPGFGAATVRLIAINAVLAGCEAQHLPALIAATEPRYAGAPKLLDRWLRAQTGSRRVDTIARVEAMVTDPRYDRNDRGRVMALWFPFATRNRSVFHDPSGAGYRVFIDELGPLLAVGLDGAPQLGQGRLLTGRFLQETRPHRRVVVRAVEGLLEPPVAELRRRRRAFHRLELRQRDAYSRVGRQRTAPIALQGQQSLGERLRHAAADEVARVID